MQKCKCGCGVEVSKEGNIYIKGHYWKGIKFSEGYINKLKESHIGQIPWNKGLEDCYTQETKKKMSESHIGHEGYWTDKKRPDMIWTKGNKFWLGKKHSEETKQKIFNKNFKGGTREWWSRELKKTYKECCLCKSTKKLEMHHKDKHSSNNERLNLIIICKKCHFFWHKAIYKI